MANYTSTGILNTTVSPTTEKGSFSFTIKLVSTLLLITTIILTLLGNSLVIRAFIVFRKLQNVTNYFVVSLAVTDILVALFSMPVWTVYLLTGIQHYGKNFFLYLVSSSLSGASNVSVHVSRRFHGPFYFL